MSFASSAILFQGFAPNESTPMFDPALLTLDTSAVELASTAALAGGEAWPDWSVDLVDRNTIEMVYLGGASVAYPANAAFVVNNSLARLPVCQRETGRACRHLS